MGSVLQIILARWSCKSRPTRDTRHSNMTTSVTPFNAQHLEAACRVLADTERGLTGTQIERLLQEIKIADTSPGMTKWKRLFDALAKAQNHPPSVRCRPCLTGVPRHQRRFDGCNHVRRFLHRIFCVRLGEHRIAVALLASHQVTHLCRVVEHVANGFGLKVRQMRVKLGLQ